MNKKQLDILVSEQFNQSIESKNFFYDLIEDKVLSDDQVKDLLAYKIVKVHIVDTYQKNFSSLDEAHQVMINQETYSLMGNLLGESRHEVESIIEYYKKIIASHEYLADREDFSLHNPNDLHFYEKTTFLKPLEFLTYYDN